MSFRHINMHLRLAVTDTQRNTRQIFLEVWTVLYFPLNKAAGSSHGGYTLIYTGDCYTGELRWERRGQVTQTSKNNTDRAILTSRDENLTERGRGAGVREGGNITREELG